MAIRLRKVDGVLIAICAARSVPKEGDIYLDDAAHEALNDKFGREFYAANDMDSERFMDSPRWSNMLRLVEREESNNPNREWWEKEYGGG